MLRFLPGIILLQLAAVAMVFVFINAPQDWNLRISLALVVLVLTLAMAFWFASIGVGLQRDRLEKLREEHAQEREKLKLNTERQKARLLQENHREILKESRRVNARANFKVGVGLAAAASVGVLMLFTQFLTVGLLLVSTSGGALAGYLMRARQEQKRLRENPPVAALIEVNPPVKAAIRKRA